MRDTETKNNGEQLTPENLSVCLTYSLVRGGQQRLPWSEEQSATAPLIWISVLNQHGIRTTSSLARLLTFAHDNRRASDLGRPVTLDHLVHIIQRRKAGLEWSIREERWIDTRG